MIEPYEIRPLFSLNLDEILPVVTGYESMEKFAVAKQETDERTLFTIQLTRLDAPHRSSFVSDFQEEDCRRYESFLPQGYSFGVYSQERLVALAISEAIPWNNALRIWEFQVMQAFRRQGIGRALMNHVVAKAAQDQFRIVFLETQNTNVPAIRFYRTMGFSLDALDLSFYTNHDVEDGEVMFFMKQKLE
jgi:ribosomal protein S18 acetylase RimI-like enzyme